MEVSPILLKATSVLLNPQIPKNNNVHKIQISLPLDEKKVKFYILIMVIEYISEQTMLW